MQKKITLFEDKGTNHGQEDKQMVVWWGGGKGVGGLQSVMIINISHKICQLILFIMCLGGGGGLSMDF